MKNLLIAALSLVISPALSQGFSGKTDAIKINYKQPIVTTTLPSITWKMPATEVTNSIEKSIVVEATVYTEVPLKSVLLEVTNGGERREKKININAGELDKTIIQSLSLMDGENIIRLIVENEKGGVVKSSRSVFSGTDAFAVDINRKDYALIFATDNYDYWDDLTNPVNDGRTIGEILKDKYGFEVEIVENASSEEVMAKIFDYNTKSFKPQDQLFVFFAGHGSFDETLDEGYVVASNSLLNDKGRSTYLSHILIRERLNNIKCEHIFLMMDVCFGGTIDPVLAKARAGEDMDEAIDKQYLVKKLTKPTRKFLTSGSKEYVPDGIPGKHSPFAEKFILALKEIGGGTGRILSLIELRPYFMRLSSETRFGSFGRDDPASDFVFVARQ